MTNQTDETKIKTLYRSFPLYVFLFLFAISLGFDLPGIWDSVYDQKRVVQLVVLILLALSMVFLPTVANAICKAWLVLPFLSRYVFLTVVVLGGVSSLLAPYQNAAFQEWSLFGLLFLLILYLQSTLYKQRNEKIVLTWLGFGVLLYSWRYFSSAFLPSLFNQHATVGYELFIGFAHPRFYNQIQSWLLPLLVLLPIAFTKTPRRYLWVLWIPGITSWTLLFASSGRGTLIAMAISTVAVLIIFKNKAKAWIKIHLWYAGSGLLLYVGLFRGLPWLMNIELSAEEITSRLANAGLMGRDSLWNYALQMIIDNPVLGIGPQQYAIYDVHKIAAHPHSAPLQWMSEWGLLSFLLISGLLIFGFSNWISFCKKKFSLGDKNSLQNMLLIALTASLLSGATHSLVSGVIVMPYSQLLMCTVIGWTLATYYREREATTLTVSLRYRLLASGCATILLGILVFTTGSDVLTTDKRQKEYLAEHPQQTILRPRIWNQGHIAWQGEIN